jgi:hypothetical protein
VTVPLLVLVGGEDQISRKLEITEFFKRCNSDDIKLQIFKKGMHNLHMGREKDTVKTCVLKWVTAQMATAAPLGSVSREASPLYKKRRSLGVIKIVIALLLYFKGLQQYSN